MGSHAVNVMRPMVDDVVRSVKVYRKAADVFLAKICDRLTDLLVW